jgi:hypothetical protein
LSCGLARDAAQAPKRRDLKFACGFSLPSVIRRCEAYVTPNVKNFSLSLSRPERGKPEKKGGRECSMGEDKSTNDTMNAEQNELMS